MVKSAVVDTHSNHHSPAGKETSLKDAIDDVSVLFEQSSDREQTSHEQIDDIIDKVHADLDDLPIVWIIDENLLPSDTREKIKRRRAAGLANPIHADGASEIVAKSAQRHNSLGRVDKSLSPLQDRAELNARQKVALHEELIFDGPKDQIEVSRNAIESILTLFETRRNQNQETVSTGPLILFIATFLIFITGGIFPGLIASATAVSLIGFANYNRSRCDDLNSSDYRAMELATVPADSPDKSSREYKLAQIAYGLCDEIKRNGIYKSNFLSQNNIELDPMAEADAIARQAVLISEIRRKVVSARTNQNRDIGSVLERVENSMKGRVSALLRYTVELSTLEQECTNINSYKKLGENNFDIYTLLAKSGIDEVSIINNNISADILRNKAEIISAQVELMSEDIEIMKKISP